jgi:hypothetical protein
VSVRTVLGFCHWPRKLRMGRCSVLNTAVSMASRTFESDGFAVGEPVEVGAHGSVEVEADDLAARGANVGGAAQIRMWVAGAAFSRNEGNSAVGRSLC